MDSHGKTTSHLSGLFYRNINLLLEGIKPVYVFDGKPPELKGRELMVNANAETGGIDIEMLDENGAVLSGFGREGCDTIRKDGIKQVAGWRGRTDCSLMEGRTVRLRFFLRKAQLYGFQVAG